MRLLFLQGPAEESLLARAEEGLRGVMPDVDFTLVQERALPAAQQRVEGRYDFALLSLTEGSEDEWQRLVHNLQLQKTVVALATIFRHVPHDHPRRSEWREEIRRRNAMARRLSHKTGAYIFDVDRELAHKGALKLQADCFGGGEAAADVALSELMTLILETAA
jgi:hypothetical protein